MTEIDLLPLEEEIQPTEAFLRQIDIASAAGALCHGGNADSF